MQKKNKRKEKHSNLYSRTLTNNFSIYPKKKKKSFPSFGSFKNVFQGL